MNTTKIIAFNPNQDIIGGKYYKINPKLPLSLQNGFNRHSNDNYSITIEIIDGEIKQTASCENFDLNESILSEEEINLFGLDLGTRVQIHYNRAIYNVKLFKMIDDIKMTFIEADGLSVENAILNLKRKILKKLSKRIQKQNKELIYPPTWYLLMPGDTGTMGFFALEAMLRNNHVK